MKSGATVKIIILDDHKAFREQVVDILVRNGHEACGVADAADAIPLAESGVYDFILVDFNMPGHDGAWFMKNVKRPLRTKAILVTAHVRRPVIDMMFKAGVCGYLAKPFTEADLLRHLEFHARGAMRVAG
jgi:CheY-like chemotaxis protein